MSRKSDTKSCTKYTPRFCAIKKLCKAIQPYTAHYWQQLIKSLCKHAPKKVVYISCNPETLARDLKYLLKEGYKAKKCIAVDMFSHTAHTECVVLLQK